MTPCEFAIEIRGLTRFFGATAALSEVSLHVSPGEVLGLVGPNGAGKTTLVRLLTGLLRPDGGGARVLGLDPQHRGEEVRARTGVLTESAGHYRHLTGLQELVFFAHMHGVPQPDQAARHWLDAVGLGDAADQQVGGYSTGMARRLGLARALLHSPEVLLLDEPTSGLDPGGIRHVLTLLAENAKQRGTTVVLCSHVLAQLESVCHRYAVLQRGRLVAHGTVEQLATQLDLPAVAKLRLRGAVPAAVMGMPLQALGQDAYQVALANPQQLPALVAELARVCQLWHVELQDRSLEHVYFKLVGPPA